MKGMSKTYGTTYNEDTEIEHLLSDNNKKQEAVGEILTFSRLPIYIGLGVSLLFVLVLLSLKKSMF
jgi:hypothetical protein